MALAVMLKIALNGTQRENVTARIKSDNKKFYLIAPTACKRFAGMRFDSSEKDKVSGLFVNCVSLFLNVLKCRPNIRQIHKSVYFTLFFSLNLF